VCETARLVGVDPHGYLLRAVYAAIARPGATTFPEEYRAGDERYTVPSGSAARASANARPSAFKNTNATGNTRRECSRSDTSVT
jgi:hypothetical protein